MYRRAPVCSSCIIMPLRAQWEISGWKEEAVLADCVELLESTLCLKAIRRLLSTGNVSPLQNPSPEFC